MSLRALMHTALAASLLLFALAAGAAEVIRFGYLELNKDARYDERKTFFRTLSRPYGPPFAGAEVALREARFVGQALGVWFLATAIGNNLAGQFAGEFDPNNIAAMPNQFLGIFWWGAIGGLVMFLVSPFAKRLMGGVK